MGGVGEGGSNREPRQRGVVAMKFVRIRVARSGVWFCLCGYDMRFSVGVGQVDGNKHPSKIIVACIAQAIYTKCTETVRLPSIPASNKTTARGPGERAKLPSTPSPPGTTPIKRAILNPTPVHDPKFTNSSISISVQTSPPSLSPSSTPFACRSHSNQCGGKAVF